MNVKKAVFFSGHGTVYTYAGSDADDMEIYPESLHALRFLQRRGFLLVLLTPDINEYRYFKNSQKDKNLNIYHVKGGEDGIRRFIWENDIDVCKSYYITDSVYINIFHRLGIKIILTLTGKGYFTYNELDNKEMNVFMDVCKNIYAAAFRVVFDNDVPN